MVLYLASASPRRRELLERLGFAPRLVTHAVDERIDAGESPEAYVARLATEKAHAATACLDTGAPPGVLLAADTVVTLDGDVLGKPADGVDAARMLHRLSGQVHRVLTGVFLMRTDDSRTAAVTESSDVQFRALDDATVGAYVRSGEPMGKAGAYAIQGRGALLTRGLRGSWSNVVGLPIERLPECLERIGLDPLGAFEGRLSLR